MFIPDCYIIIGYKIIIYQLCALIYINKWVLLQILVQANIKNTL